MCIPPFYQSRSYFIQETGAILAKFRNGVLLLRSDTSFKIEREIKIVYFFLDKWLFKIIEWSNALVQIYFRKRKFPDCKQDDRITDANVGHGIFHIHICIYFTFSD